MGRADFATELANAVASWRQKDSLVVALYGEWGSGKSSVKNMMREALPQGEGAGPNLLEFNPWEWAGQNELTQGFFSEVAIALGAPDNSGKAKQRAAKWNMYRARLRIAHEIALGTRGLLPVLLFIAGVLGIAGWTRHPLFLILGAVLLLAAGVLALMERTAGGLVDVITARAAAEEKTLPQLKQELAELTAVLEQPLVVVLDDIDRLTPPQIRLLFQLIKANGDFPNFVYLLLCQRDLVADSLTEGPINGEDFLEKIVQVAFDIPVVSQQRIDKVLFAGLNEILEDEAVAQRFDEHRWGNIFIGGMRPFFKSLRQVRRYLGTLSFTTSLLKSETAFEVNPIDLMAVEALRTFVPSVHAAIGQNKDLMTSTDAGFQRREESQREAITAIIDQAPEEHRDATRELVQQLFPTVEWALGGSHYSSEFLEQWQRELRVCHPNFFDRYFQLAVAEDDLTQADIERILRLVGDREGLEALLRSLYERGLLNTAFNRLEAYKQQIELRHAEPFITAIFNVGDLLSRERVGFEVGADMHAVRVVHWFLKQEPDRKRRGEILARTMEASTGLYLPVMKTSLEDRRQEREVDEEAYLVEPEQVETLKKTCVAKIEEAAKSGRLAEHPHLAYILYRWSEWDSPDKPRSWAAELAQSSEGALTLVRGLSQETTSHTMGDYVARSRWVVRLNEVENFVDLPTMKTRIDELDEIPDESAAAVKAFRRALKAREEGHEEDDWRYDDD